MTRFYPFLCFLVCLAAVCMAQVKPALPDRSSPVSFSDQPGVALQAGAQPQLQAQSEVPPAPDHSPDPLLDPPPMPKGKVTLIGGTVKNMDQVRDKLVVEVFGGRAMKMSFDERTRFFRDGIETTQLAVRKGDRVYVDTMLDGSRVFARNVRVGTGVRAADSTGQVVSVNGETLMLQDQLSGQALAVQLNQKTVVLRQKKPVSRAELTPGSIVAVRFAPERANRGTAQEISIIAAPGMKFTFAGKVTNIDLRIGVFSVENQTDLKIYDLKFSPVAVDKRDAFGIGSLVNVVTTFTGTGYRAESVQVTAPPTAASN